MTKSKKIIIAIVAILVVLGGTFAGLWFFTDVFNFLKPANEVFSNQVEKALNVEGAKFSDYSDFLKDYKEISGKPYTLKMNLSANLNIKDVDKDVKDIINKSKITLEQNADVSNKKIQNKIGLYSDNSEILTLDLITTDKQVAVGCKDLYNKYLSVSFEDILELAKKEAGANSKELEQAFNSLSNVEIDPYELLYISDEDLKHFDDTYRNCLETSISKDCYSSKNGVEVEVDGEDVKTNAYYLTMTGKDVYEFLDNLTKKVKDDEVIVKIATEKANLILEAASQDKISEDDVKEALNDFIDEFMSEMEDIKDADDSAVQIAIYSKGSNPVKIEVKSLENADDEEGETLLSVEYGKDKTTYSIYNEGKSVATIINEFSKNSKEEKVGKIKVKASGIELGSLDYEIVSKDSESKLKLDLSVPMADITGSVDISSKGNYKKEEVTFDGKVAFEYDGQGAEINFDGSMEYGKADVPELNSSNSVDILKLKEDEQQKVLTDILEKAAEVLPKRLKLIGIDIDSKDIMPSNTNTTPATTTEPAIQPAA